MVSSRIARQISLDRISSTSLEVGASAAGGYLDPPELTEENIFDLSESCLTSSTDSDDDLSSSGSAASESDAEAQPTKQNLQRNGKIPKWADSRLAQTPVPGERTVENVGALQQSYPLYRTLSAGNLAGSSHEPDASRSQEMVELDVGSRSYPTTCDCAALDTVIVDTVLKHMTVAQVYAFLYGMDDGLAQNGVYRYLVDQMECTEITLGAFQGPPAAFPRKRSLSYVMPIKGNVPMAPKQTWVRSEENQVQLDAMHAVVHTSTQTPDVPTGPNFHVLSHACLLQTHAHQVRLRVTARVSWSKQVWMLKSIVEAGTIDGQKKYWAGLLTTLPSRSAATVSPQPQQQQPSSSSGAANTPKRTPHRRKKAARPSTPASATSSQGPSGTVATRASALHTHTASAFALLAENTSPLIIALMLVHLVLFLQLLYLHQQLRHIEAMQRSILSASPS